ncbi:TIGR02588 family protein [Ciceribacter sp. T2.26MG-112.2]|uniref:TIGR02588 family protein n=1 Tax=Ciceribacter sp. T2.26MG-112.2 TaxID=3137154 RepID=UPI0012B69EA8|nr:TIGR02588 family protein [Ciceribacter naphthalenivorans]
MSPSHRPRHTEADDPHWMEWLTGLVSAALIATLIGYVGWNALTEQMDPPEFAIEATGMERMTGGYRITFDIENRANSTAAAVVVRGELLRGEESVETVDVTFDYVPGESQSSGAILFTTDPGSAQLTLRAIGYTDP